MSLPVARRRDKRLLGMADHASHRQGGPSPPTKWTPHVAVYRVRIQCSKVRTAVPEAPLL